MTDTITQFAKRMAPVFGLGSQRLECKSSHAGDGFSVRWRILHALHRSPRTGLQLEHLVDMSQTATSYHVGVLRAARLVQSHKSGKSRLHSLTELGETIHSFVLAAQVALDAETSGNSHE